MNKPRNPESGMPTPPENVQTAPEMMTGDEWITSGNFRNKENRVRERSGDDLGFYQSRGVDNNYEPREIYHGDIVQLLTNDYRNGLIGVVQSVTSRGYTVTLRVAQEPGRERDVNFAGFNLNSVSRLKRIKHGTITCLGEECVLVSRAFPTP
jgi:hypothetical protein